MGEKYITMVQKDEGVADLEQMEQDYNLFFYLFFFSHESFYVMKPQLSVGGTQDTVIRTTNMTFLYPQTHTVLSYSLPHCLSTAHLAASADTSASGEHYKPHPLHDPGQNQAFFTKNGLLNIFPAKLCHHKDSHTGSNHLSL